MARIAALCTAAVAALALVATATAARPHHRPASSNWGSSAVWGNAHTLRARPASSSWS